MTPLTRAKPLQVAIGSLGTVGSAVACRLDEGIEGLVLSAVSARDTGKASQTMQQFKRPVPILPLDQLTSVADVVIECAPADVFCEIAEPAVRAGRIFIPISVGALLSHWHIAGLAKTHGARIIVPTGALVGLDAVRAAAEAHIDRVQIVTRKPPGALRGSPYLKANSINVEGLTQPLRVFAGSAREGALGFPANVNVAAALGLAGIGVDRTQLEIWADPSVSRNTHTIIVDSDSSRLELKIENIPSRENPRTGRIVAQSVIATLRRLVDTVTIGT